MRCISSVVSAKTPWGRHLYATGGNEEAARRAGIDVRHRTRPRDRHRGPPAPPAAELVPVAQSTGPQLSDGKRSVGTTSDNHRRTGPCRVNVLPPCTVPPLPKNRSSR